jgi:hypothetical protein
MAYRGNMKKRRQAKRRGGEIRADPGDEELAKRRGAVKELDTGVQRALLIETAIGLLQK